jgi:hypothetical protein
MDDYSPILEGVEVQELKEKVLKPEPQTKEPPLTVDYSSSDSSES